MYVMYDIIPNAGITQKIKITKTMKTSSIRLGLIKGGTVDGDVTLTILDGATELASATRTGAEFNALATYAHGFFYFDLKVALGVLDTEADHEYTLKVVYDGAESEVNYIGLKKAHENNTVLAYGSNQSDGVPISDTFAPYEIELYRWS